MRHYGYNLVRSYLLKFLFYAQRKLFGYMWDIQGIYNYLNSSSTERVRIKNTKSNLHSIYFCFDLEGFNQGYNKRKVILEVYASFVLQCTVSYGR